MSILKFLLAAGILTWLIQNEQIHFEEIAASAFSLQFIAIFILTFFSTVLVSERFRLLLKTQNLNLSMVKTLELSLIGYFFNFLIPGGVGGDAVKAYYLKKEQSLTSSTSPYAVIIDRAFGMYIIVAMGLCAMFLSRDLLQQSSDFFKLYLYTLGLFAIMTGVLLLSATRSFQDAVIKFLPKSSPFSRVALQLFLCFNSYLQSPKKILITFALTILGLTFIIFALFLAGIKHPDGSLPLSAYFIVAPIALAIASLPITPPGGIGVGQAAFLFLFNIYLGRQSTLGPTIATTYQIACLFVALIGAILYILRKKAA